MSDLVRRDDDALISAALDGLSNLDSSDFALPFVSIGQSSSEKRKAGSFNWNDGRTSELLEGMMLILIVKGRVLFGGGKARCKSDTFERPAGYIKEPYASYCGICPASQWGADHEEKIRIGREVGMEVKNKPLCTETYNVVLLDSNSNELIILQLHGSNYLETKNKLPPLLQRHGGHAYKEKFDITLKKVGGGGRSWYVVHYANFRKTDQEEQQRARYIIKTRGKDIIKDISAQYEAMEREVQEAKVEQHENNSQELRDDDLPF